MNHLLPLSKKNESPITSALKTKLSYTESPLDWISDETHPAGPA